MVFDPSLVCTENSRFSQNHISLQFLIVKSCSCLIPDILAILREIKHKYSIEWDFIYSFWIIFFELIFKFASFGTAAGEASSTSTTTATSSASKSFKMLSLLIGKFTDDPVNITGS